MTLLEALKTENLRITYGNRWLVREENGDWVIYRSGGRGRPAQVVYMGGDEERAVNVLLND